MQVTGTVVTIGKEINVTDTFKKRTLLIDQDSKYPQKLQVEFHNERCALLEGVTAGSKVKVNINLRSNPWKNDQGEVRYFTYVTGWELLPL